MQLGKAKAVCLFNYNAGGVWNINSDFYNCSCNKNLYFSGRKIF